MDPFLLAWHIPGANCLLNFQGVLNMTTLGRPNWRVFWLVENAFRLSQTPVDSDCHDLLSHASKLHSNLVRAKGGVGGGHPKSI